MASPFGWVRHGSSGVGDFWTTTSANNVSRHPAFPSSRSTAHLQWWTNACHRGDEHSGAVSISILLSATVGYYGERPPLFGRDWFALKEAANKDIDHLEQAGIVKKGSVVKLGSSSCLGAKSRWVHMPLLVTVNRCLDIDQYILSQLLMIECWFLLLEGEDS